jgi:predicted  nucleic acid-binding Zn-ribbon protein
MTDPAREKYSRLMTEIEDLEERVEDLEKEMEVVKGSPDAKVVKDELEDLRVALATKRNELARLSDGCGKPHPR